MRNMYVGAATFFLTSVLLLVSIGVGASQQPSASTTEAPGKQSGLVTVTGAVGTPSRFDLKRPVRLLELLDLAGGISKNAGASVKVRSRATAAACCESTGDAESSPVGDENKSQANHQVYSLERALGGDESANPYVQPGDVITVPFKYAIIVAGAVEKPSMLTPRKPVTLSQAIALAGGMKAEAKREKIRVIRQNPDGKPRQSVFQFNLKQAGGNAAMFELQTEDIVHVMSEGGFKDGAGRGALLPSIEELPVHVVR